MQDLNICGRVVIKVQKFWLMMIRQKIFELTNCSFVLDPQIFLLNIFETIKVKFINLLVAAARLLMVSYWKNPELPPLTLWLNKTWKGFRIKYCNYYKLLLYI